MITIIILITTINGSQISRLYDNNIVILFNLVDSGFICDFNKSKLVVCFPDRT